MTDLAKTRAIFALQKLPANLRSRTLADGSIASRFGIGVNSPIPILDKTVEREQLFARFREAADGQTPTPLRDLSGTDLQARIQIDSAGDGSVKIGNADLRFPQAGLLTSDAMRRQAYAQRMIADHSLTAWHQTELLALAAQPAFSEKEFFQALGLLSATPQTFARIFREKLLQTNGNIGEPDLLPDDPRYWANLTAEPGASPDLPTFIAAELLAERRRQLTAHPLRTFRTISLSFCAPALVPKDLLDELAVDTVVPMMESISKFDDPFALVGAFEYCAASADKDPRFAALGEQLLLRLVADMDWLRRAASLWTTGFVIATTALARTPTRSTGAAWRPRLMPLWWCGPVACATVIRRTSWSGQFRCAGSNTIAPSCATCRSSHPGARNGPIRESSRRTSFPALTPHFIAFPRSFAPPPGGSA
jgi:hypothetical protein